MSWRRDRLPPPVFLGFPCGSAGKESACNAGDLGLIPGLGRSPGEGKGYPLQYSCLGNSMDCVAHRVAKRHDWESFTHSLLTISGSSMSPWLQISSSFSCINEVNFSPNGCFIECHSVPFLPCFEMLVFKVYLKWQVFFLSDVSLASSHGQLPLYSSNPSCSSSDDAYVVFSGLLSLRDLPLGDYHTWSPALSQVLTLRLSLVPPTSSVSTCA